MEVNLKKLDCTLKELYDKNYKHLKFIIEYEYDKEYDPKIVKKSFVEAMTKVYARELSQAEFYTYKVIKEFNKIPEPMVGSSYSIDTKECKGNLKIHNLCGDYTRKWNHVTFSNNDKNLNISTVNFGIDIYDNVDFKLEYSPQKGKNHIIAVSGENISISFDNVYVWLSKLNKWGGPNKFGSVTETIKKMYKLHKKRSNLEDLFLRSPLERIEAHAAEKGCGKILL